MLRKSTGELIDHDFVSVMVATNTANILTFIVSISPTHISDIYLIFLYLSMAV